MISFAQKCKEPQMVSGSVVFVEKCQELKQIYLNTLNLFMLRVLGIIVIFVINLIEIETH